MDGWKRIGDTLGYFQWLHENGTEFLTLGHSSISRKVAKFLFAHEAGGWRFSDAEG